MNALEKTLDNDNTMAKLNSVAPSDTERMAEISVNDAEKIDVCNLSKENIEMNPEDKVSLNDSEAYKVVDVNEYEQLEDLKPKTVDVNSVDKPQEDFNTRVSSKKEIENNPGDKGKDYEDCKVEEHVNTFEDKDGGLNDNLDIIEEGDYNNEENPEEKAAAEDLSISSCFTCLDAEIYSEETFQNARLFSEVESKDVRLFSEGTFIEISDEILKNHDRFLDAKLVNKEVTYLEVNNYHPNIKNTVDENGKEQDDKARKYDEKDDDDLNPSKTAKNLKDKVSLNPIFFAQFWGPRDGPKARDGHHVSA